MLRGNVATTTTAFKTVTLYNTHALLETLRSFRSLLLLLHTTTLIRPPHPRHPGIPPKGACQCARSHASGGQRVYWIGWTVWQFSLPSSVYFGRRGAFHGRPHSTGRYRVPNSRLSTKSCRTRPFDSLHTRNKLYATSGTSPLFLPSYTHSSHNKGT